MDKDKLDLQMKLGKVFNPGAPISQMALFAGRMIQLTTIINAINQRGQHAIIFGERGVGKTSLTNVLSGFFENRDEDQKWLRYARINCDAQDTYFSIWKKIFRELTIVYERKGIGFVPNKENVVFNLESFISEDVKPEDVRYELEKLDGLHILVIDEFDRVTSTEATSLMADTIKTFSDHLLNATLILVGVADAVDDLIDEHASVERSLVQIHMPRMSVSELQEIVCKALEAVEMEIDDQAKDWIVQLSQGLPHYTHLLGLHSSQKAVEMDRSRVIIEDVNAALKQAVNEAQQSIQRRYHQATSSPRKTIFPEVLLACALAETDELGYFSAADIRKPLSAIMGKEYGITAYSRHLNDFCEMQRGPLLIKTGVPRRYRFRFINPLMQPYVVMKGLADELISKELLRSIDS